jgi:hypothetical protein
MQGPDFSASREGFVGGLRGIERAVGQGNNRVQLRIPGLDQSSNLRSKSSAASSPLLSAEMVRPFRWRGTGVRSGSCPATGR